MTFPASMHKIKTLDLYIWDSKSIVREQFETNSQSHITRLHQLNDGMMFL